MSAVLEPLTTESATLSQQIGAFARNFDFSRVPAPVIDYAKLCIADSIGIAFASHSYPFAAKCIDGIAALAGTGEFPVIGSQLKLPVRDAALLNGLLIHGLDFDDTHSGAVTHCSTSAVPLVLTEGTRLGVSGAQALAAYLLAIEVDARLGQLADGMLQKTGFHPTGLVGVFGCSVAAGYLNQLTADQIAGAQGIALSMASGSLEFLEDGSWTKRMHPGWAASSAITAVSLAKHQFQAPANAYEGRYGFYNLYLQNQSIDPQGLADDLGHQWETLKVAIKPYPVCHFNHACIDAMLTLREEHDLQPKQIQSITALIHRKQHDVVCLPAAAKRRPQNDYDAKFSLPHAVATAAVRGRFGLAELEEDALGDPTIQALRDRVQFAHYDDSRYPQYYSGAVEVQTADGRTLRHDEPINRGADSRALDHDAVKTKFLGNTQRSIDAARAEQLWAAIQSLDQSPDLKQLNSLLAAGA